MNQDRRRAARPPQGADAACRAPFRRPAGGCGPGAAEHRRAYFVDRFSATLFVQIIAVLILCVVDAVLTLALIHRGGEEFNPLMGCLLAHGMRPFLIGKYVLTAVGLPLLLIFKNHGLFGTRFRVGHLIPIIVALYLVLIAYQTILIMGDRLSPLSRLLRIAWIATTVAAPSRSGRRRRPRTGPPVPASGTVAAEPPTAIPPPPCSAARAPAGGAAFSGLESTSACSCRGVCQMSGFSIAISPYSLQESTFHGKVGEIR